MTEIVTIIVLALLNVFQLIYWGAQLQKLVDKLMSRNYGEYVQTNNTQTVVKQKTNIDDEPKEDFGILENLGVQI